MLPTIVVPSLSLPPKPEYEFDKYIVPRLTPAARALYPISRADDPGLLRCEPWGMVRQFTALHAVEIKQFDDRLEFQYAEWYGRRTIHLGLSKPPADLPLFAGLLGGTL